MIPGFEAIVEERIRQAQKEGAFDDLPGKGKPLDLEESQGPEELRLAHKILKNAGFLPPEVELRKKISQTRELMDSLEADSPEQAKARKKLNYMLAKLDSLRGAGSCSQVLTDQYRQNLIHKLSR